MFLQFKKIRNESGIVLFIVLMSAIIIMIYSFTVLSQSINENDFTQQQIDQIVSDQWYKGVFWNAYASGFANGNYVSSVTLENRVYSASVTYSNVTNVASVTGFYNSLD